MLTLIAFVLPLGLDSFAVAAVLGAAGRLTYRSRLRISVLFVAFEAGMPVIGLALGAPLARAIGDAADYLATAALIGIGTWMLVHGEQDEQQTASRLTTARGVTAIGLGISISLDELGIGFSLGLTRLPPTPAIIAIAVQAFLASQLGLHLGARIGERFREAVERLAAIALIALGLCLAVNRLLHA